MEGRRFGILRASLLFLAFWGLGAALVCADPADTPQPARPVHTERFLDHEDVRGLTRGPLPAEMAKRSSIYRIPESETGPYNLRVVVTDKKTGKPIPKYRLDADFMYISGEGKPGGTNLAYDVGYLETLNVDNPEGVGIYKNLAPANYEVYVAADGYPTHALLVNVPDDGDSLVFELLPPRTIRGRLVDAVTARPLSDVPVDLRFSSYKLHPGVTIAYSTRTHKNGVFEFKNLPGDVYSVEFPEFPKDPSNLSVGLSHRKIPEPYRMPPELGRIDLHEEGGHDFGDIPVHRYPVLNVSIVDKKGNPLALYPFQVQIPKTEGRPYPTILSSETDDQGNRKLSLIGWEAGEVSLFVPSRLSGAYRFREQKKDPFGTESGQFDEAAARTEALLTLREVATRDGIGPLPDEKLIAKYRDRFDDLVNRWRRGFKARMNRPSHPNRTVVTPQPDQQIPVHIVYHPTELDASLHLLVRHKTTKAPVSSFKGKVSFARSPMSFFEIAGRPDSHWVRDTSLAAQGDRILDFQSKDQSGRIRIDPLPLPEGVFQAIQMGAANTAAGAKTGTGRPIDYVAFVGVEADGYVPEVFEVTLAKLRSGKDVVLDLEREAVVKGRVLFGRTGKPLTHEALTEALKAEGIPARDLRLSPRNGRGRSPVSIEMSNSLVEGTFDPSRRTHFVSHFMAHPGPDGRFEIRGVRPESHWAFKVSAPELVTIRQRGMDLRPGVNDVGDIYLDLPGRLEGFVSDEKGSPVPGTSLVFPLRQYLAFQTEATTGASGEFSVDLGVLQQDRQVIRIIPAWGYHENLPIDDSPRMPPSLWFDTIATLNRTGRTRWDLKIPRGHTLIVKLPPTTPTLALFQYYGRLENMSVVRYEGTDSRVQYYFGLAGAAVQGLDPIPPQGLIYQQLHSRFQKGLRLTTRTLTLKIANVPPGRQALRLDAGFYSRYPKVKDDTQKSILFLGVEPSSSFHEEDMDCLVERLPIAYSEFVMPETTYTLTLHPNGVDVQIGFAEVAPRALPDDYVDAEVTFERKTPVSTGLGNEVRRIFAQVSHPEGRTVEQLLTPMVGYAGGLYRVPKESAGDSHKSSGLAYRPLLFRDVPPGKYRLAVYASSRELASPSPKPYFEKEIEIPKGNKKIDLVVPRPPRSTRVETRPALGGAPFTPML